MNQWPALAGLACTSTLLPHSAWLPLFWLNDLSLGFLSLSFPLLNFDKLVFEVDVDTPVVKH